VDDGGVGGAPSSVGGGVGGGGAAACCVGDAAADVAVVGDVDGGDEEVGMCGGPVGGGVPGWSSCC